MILENMNACEVQKEIIRDLDKVLFRLKRNEGQARKAFSRLRMFPKVYTDVYTCPASRNRHLLWYVAQNPDDERRMGCSGHCCLVPERNSSFSFVTLKQPENRHDGIMQKNVLYNFSCHFIDRYRERILKDTAISVWDAAALLLARNPVYVVLDMKKEFNLFFDRYGSRYAVSMPDGLCFVDYGYPVIEEGDVKDEAKDDDRLFVVDFKTIISRSIMKPVQREHERKDVLNYMMQGAEIGVFSKAEAKFMAMAWTDATRASEVADEARFIKSAIGGNLHYPETL